ncbi:MAG TPA: LiaI-LiaF-like domain-containing protein [Cyclobacteriaceae bacterium]
MDKYRNKALVGIILVAIGIVLLLNNFGLLPFFLPHYLFTWEVLLILIGLISFLSGRITQAIILILVGVVFLFTDYLDIRFWDLWPILLIIIGASFFIRYRKSSDDDFSAISQDELLEDTAVFGGTNKTFKAENFRGGKITALFGGSNVDLRNCQLAVGVSKVDVLVVFGGSKLYLPDTWNVKINATPIFGGIDDKRDSNAGWDESGTLILTGLVLFGGIEILS